MYNNNVTNDRDDDFIFLGVLNNERKRKQWTKVY